MANRQFATLLMFNISPRSGDPEPRNPACPSTPARAGCQTPGIVARASKQRWPVALPDGLPDHGQLVREPALRGGEPDEVEPGSHAAPLSIPPVPLERVRTGGH